jgi:hypothetical protein
MKTQMMLDLLFANNTLFAAKEDDAAVFDLI